MLKRPRPYAAHQPCASRFRLAAALALAAFAFGCGSRSGDEQSAASLPELSPPEDPAGVLGGIALADVALQRGITYAFPRQPRPMTTLRSFGAGCACFDFNDDGWLDALLMAEPHPILYRNLDGEKFEDVTAVAGLTSLKGHWTGCAVADYDGDARLDLLLTGHHCLALLRNADGQHFVEETGQANLDPLNHGQWGASAGFMDLDSDGDLDLLVVNYVVFGPESRQHCELAPGFLSGCPPQEYEPEFVELWRNDGHGVFELAPRDATGMKDTNGAGMVLAFCDYDDDRRSDVYIGNDARLADLMHNEGNFKFTNVGTLAGVSVGRYFRPMSAMGADWGDFDRDGFFDLTVTDFQKNCFALFRNLGNGFFREVSNATGLSTTTCNRLGFGAKWIDLDNDGWADLSFINGHVYDSGGDVDGSAATSSQPMMLFRNLEGRRFVDLVPFLGDDIARPVLGRGSATGDFNRDGRTDLLVVDYEGPTMLLENCSRTPGHWLTLELRGKAPNHFAYGARAVGRSGNQVWVGQVSPASSYLSSSSLEIHWGLGAADHLDSLSIYWPAGDVEVFTDIAGDQILRLTQAGAAQPEGGEIDGKSTE